MPKDEVYWRLKQLPLGIRYLFWLKPLVDSGHIVIKVLYQCYRHVIGIGPHIEDDSKTYCGVDIILKLH